MNERPYDERRETTPGPTGASNDSLKERTKEEAKQRVDELRDKSREAAESVRRKAERKVDRQTSRAATTLESVERALCEAARELDEDGRDRMADFTRSAAGQISRVGAYLEDEDAPAMLSDLEDMARSNPATFIGTSFATGLALGRFLRASGSPATTDELTGATPPAAGPAAGRP
jgi:ElaB/YqjD/DUF883 family membrane-anchored ribosome-binding protein